jgi:hypothetical protein
VYEQLVPDSRKLTVLVAVRRNCIRYATDSEMQNDGIEEPRKKWDEEADD